MDYISAEQVHHCSVPIQRSCGNLHGSFGGIGNMAAFPSTGDKDVHISEDQQSRPIIIQHLKRSSWLYGRFQRKLVNESLGTFLSLQMAGKEEDELASVLLKKSREYRSMIQACVAEMNKYLESVENGQDIPITDNIQELKSDCELLYKMELVLGLAEIIFIDTQSGPFILDPLMGWVRMHFPQCREIMSECLSMDQPHLHAQFWDACYGLVLQGLVSEARGLIAQHPDSSSDAFLSIDELLRKMPVHQSYTGLSESEFNVRWLHWKSECEGRLTQQEFSSNHNLEKICKILCGNQETLSDFTNVVDTWYHMMASQLLFTNPSVMVHRLPAAAQEALSIFGLEIQMGSLDELLLYILEGNRHQVLKACHTVLHNLWFTGHLADLLHHSHKTEDGSNRLENIRESLVLDYSLELASHPSLWQVALKYLDHCEGQGGVAIEMILERLPPTSDSKAMKIIEAAKERNFDHVVKGVCRVMGRRCMQRGQMGAAIWWSVGSADSALTSYLAHKILRNYMKVGRFQSESLLDNLGPAMLLSDTLTFLGKYREFHMIYNEGEFEAAAELLVSLVTSGMAPKYFWPVLLDDALPLLEMTKPVVTSQQTYDLLYCLHDLNFSEETDQNGPVENDPNAKHRETEVRLALTNNLARAVIQEGTVEC